MHDAPVADQEDEGPEEVEAEQTQRIRTVRSAYSICGYSARADGPIAARR